MYYGTAEMGAVTTKFRMGIGLALLAAVTGAAQLPPQVQLDRLVLRAEQRIEEGRYEEALVALEEAGSLAHAKGLELPDRIWFRRASLALALERPAEAVQFVTRYLRSADRDADHYQDALELIEKAEAGVVRKEAVERNRPPTDSLCDYDNEEAECWIEIEPECWLWNGEWRYVVRTEGEGECVDALAEGFWVVTWTTKPFRNARSGARVEGRSVDQSGGIYIAGKKQGSGWIEDDNGQIHQAGPYRDGKREGQWTEKFFSASRAPGHIYDTVSVGPYVNGRRHGFWKITDEFDNDSGLEIVETGEYRNGMKHGPWKDEFTDGRTSISPWVNGKKHGIYEHRDASGRLRRRAPYREGEQHGLEEEFDERGKRTSWSCYEDGEATAHSWRTKKRRKPPCEER